MTRNEAIKILSIRDNRGIPVTWQKGFTDAIDVAIEALEQPCTESQRESAQEIIKCKECKFFEYDHPYIIHGVPFLGHLVCNKWGDGCRTDENGFCFMAERRTK